MEAIYGMQFVSKRSKPINSFYRILISHSSKWLSQMICHFSTFPLSQQMFVVRFATCMELVLRIAMLKAVMFFSRGVQIGIGRICAKLCDFGSAAPVGKLPRRPAKPKWGGFERLLGFSGEWRPVGTMLWMAPEMLEPPVEGETAPDGYSGDKVDVYSLGIVFWELFEWRIPWMGGKPASKREIIDLVVRKNQRLPISMTCSPRLTQLMLSMWDASPLKRPTATFVLSELESIGSNWDTLGIFSHVQVAANMSGKELIEALGMASRASLNFDNHSKKLRPHLEILAQLVGQ